MPPTRCPCSAPPMRHRVCCRIDADPFCRSAPEPPPNLGRGRAQPRRLTRDACGCGSPRPARTFAYPTALVAGRLPLRQCRALPPEASMRSPLPSSSPTYYCGFLPSWIPASRAPLLPRWHSCSSMKSIANAMRWQAARRPSGEQASSLAARLGLPSMHTSSSGWTHSAAALVCGRWVEFADQTWTASSSS